MIWIGQNRTTFDAFLNAPSQSSGLVYESYRFMLGGAYLLAAIINVLSVYDNYKLALIAYKV